MTKDNTPADPQADHKDGGVPPESLRCKQPAPSGVRLFASRFFSDYGMLAVLLLLVIFFSLVTIEKRKPGGAEAAKSVAAQITRNAGQGSRVAIVGRDTPQDSDFAKQLNDLLKTSGLEIVGPILGEPRAIRLALDKAVKESPSGKPINMIATTEHNTWEVDQIKPHVDGLGAASVVIPESYRWPVFLRSDNLINVANQIVVIAIIAIGMTMVIITGGIDLSVGSLIALSAVVTATLIAKMGGTEAKPLAMLAGAVLAILLCGVVGLFSGIMVAGFRMPPFIATLGMMLVASGVAYLISGGESIYQIPDGFVWLGRGTAILGIPNAVGLMIVLYILAHILMSRMTLGRYIYAVGGNVEAARLSGVNVMAILLFVFGVSGMMAGLGGVVLASQLKSGAPTYGLLYELYAIAAAVLGGTSLAGGQGKILGTLIGALIIGVIQNGMNLTGIQSYTQKVVLGLVILGAVLLDMLRAYTKNR